MDKLLSASFKYLCWTDGNHLKRMDEKFKDCKSLSTGSLNSDGLLMQEERDFEVSVMRDHTHGSARDWKLMHRYCLHNFTCRSAYA